MPPFDIEGGIGLALARSLSVAALVGAGGTLFYTAFVRPAGVAGAALRRMGLLALGAAVAGAGVWLLAQTRALAGGMDPASVWSVLSVTWFGHVLAARVGVLLLAAAALWWGAVVPAGLLAAAALALQAGHSHGWAMGGAWWHMASPVLHVVAGGLWLGGLPGLLVVLRVAPERAGVAVRRFSVFGLACVGAVLGTAAVQFAWLVAGVPGLAGTAYGWMVGGKIAGLSLLLAVAARNRWRLLPGLETEAGRRRLGRAVRVEIALGAAVLCAAGVLSELPPSIHVQPLWPFGWLPSLDAAREDPDILHEVLQAAAVAGLGLLLVLAGGLWAWRARGRWRRRRRLAGAAGVLAGAALLAASAPHAAPLVVPAVPTAFYRSPTGFTAASVMAGAALYPQHCAACHGAQGRGDGPLARSLPVPPADLTAAHLWMHSDGQMFWWLTHGITAPDGGAAMPGFPGLSDDQRWALIDFIRARNAGLTMDAQGHWGTPVQAPDTPVRCGDARMMLSDLRGQEVRLALGGDGACRVTDAAGLAAFAVVAPGARVVVVGKEGWLGGGGAPAMPMAMPMPMGMKM